MFLSIGVHFLEDNDETQQVPRRQLWDMYNVLEMPRNQFVANFRVSKEIFNLLLNTLKNKWTVAFRSTHIRPDIKLATFLRFVATGSYQQTVGNESFSSTSKSSAGRIICECLQLFEEWICPQWIQWPRPEEQQIIRQGFFDATGFPGVIGCVDGTHIRIKAPEKVNSRLYYNRKGYYSINAMVVCDHKLSILFVDARHPGANHDSFIWEDNVPNERMQRDFDGGKRNVWILGDGGYKLKPFLMTPFRSPKDSNERRFNKKHASTRNVVERCFGVLKNRFRCIIGSRGLHYGPEKSTQIINACCALHNICVHYKCAEEPAATSEVREVAVNEDRGDEVDDRAAAIRRTISLNL